MRRNFTLLELMVVVAIIGVLITLLMPSLERSREAAHTVVCLSNERQVFVHSQNYMTSYDNKLPALDGNTQSGTPDDYSDDIKSENPSGQSVMVQLMLYSQGLDTLPNGNYKTEEYICPRDRVPNNSMNNSDERMTSYKANHYPWLSGGVSAGAHMNNSYVQTNPARIIPKNDAPTSDLIMFSEGDWANRTIVRNYTSTFRDDIDDIGYMGIKWHYRLDHMGKRANTKTLNNIYFDGHAKTLSFWLNMDEMESTQWGYYKYR
ncbi:MAG: type II secretion system GspH family protein [Lentisphaeraceae bacterium]|nr:type II secretion system GspH family protein [Lentisphaeraceae bacterium]